MAGCALLIVCSINNLTGAITNRERWRWLFEQRLLRGFAHLADECYSEIYSTKAVMAG